MTDSSMRPEPATGTFAALRHRDFRLLFCGMLIGSLSMPMNWVAQMWLVLDLAGKEHAPFWLGVTGFARGVPLLVLSLYGGALADRLDRFARGELDDPRRRERPSSAPLPRGRAGPQGSRYAVAAGGRWQAASAAASHCRQSGLVLG